ncbi:Ger(x)C family spore germination protein [Alkalihalophilus sp. As8PL]|uniref:Ger(X)C family spore germination protein n=1 Tax=Alkalihalophilus sp. As8PL TaxID=3237103 RepID=A0AB39BX15_9BACI
MKKYLMLLVIILLLTACNNAKEIERMYYIHAIGIDYVDGHYEVYNQVLNFATMAKEAGSATDKADAKVGMASGQTINTAFHNLYHSTSQRMYWGHLAVIVFSEEALKQGIDEAIDLFARYNETRYTVWLFSTESPIKELLTTFPILEGSPVLGTLGNPIDSYRQSSFIPPIRLHRFVSDYNEPGKTVALPHITIKKDVWFDGEKEFDSLHPEGITLFSNHQYKGKLLGLDMVGYRWLQEKTNRSPIIIQHQGDPASVIMMQDPKVEIIPVTDGISPKYTIDVEIGGSVIEMEQPVSLQFLEEEAVKVIENEIRKTYEKALAETIDVYSLGYKLYQHDPQLWKKLNTDGQIPLTEDLLNEVNVKVSIQNAGKNKLKPFQ